MALGLDPSDPVVALGAFAVLVFTGFLCNAIFAYLRFNDTLLLMGLGVVIGPVLHWVEPGAMRPLTNVAGPVALILILFDGGLGLKFRDLLHGVGDALTLAFLGFGFTVGLVAAVLNALDGTPWMAALTFGGIVGGTSSVIVMTSLAYIRSTKKTDTALAVESALTDILVVVAVFAFVKVSLAQSQPTALGIAGQVGGLFGASLAIGAAAGAVWLVVVPAVRDRPFGYMLTLAYAFVVYILAETALSSLSSGGGPLAVLAFGIVLGNSASLGLWVRDHVGHEFGPGLKRFQSELAFLVRTFFFIALGIVIDPGLFTDAAALWTGAALFAALVVARYLAVGFTVKNPFLGREGWVMLLMIPRGLAAAVMAAVPAAAGLSGSQDFVAYAFIVVALSNVMSTLGGLFLGGKKPVEKEPVAIVPSRAEFGRMPGPVPGSSRPRP